MKLEISYKKENWERKHKHMEANFYISVETSKCAFAKTQAKIYEGSSFYSNQERTRRKKKKKT